MKRFLTLSFLLIFSTMVSFAQNDSKYDRAGITIIHTNYADSYSAQVDQFYNFFVPNARYDRNPVSPNIFKLGGSRNFTRTGLDGKLVYYTRVMQEDVTAFLKREKIPLKIISHIFNRQPSGVMDLSLIHHRGQYNATDEEYNISAATKRGVEALKDAGENLIAKSYISVIDHINIRCEYVSGEDSDGEYYIKGNAVGYLYKIDWSEELLNQIWDCWVDEDTPKGEIASKNAAFNAINIPIFFIGYESIPTYSEDTYIENSKKPYSPHKGKSETQLKKEAVQRFLKAGTEKCFYNFENKNEDLTLKTTVYDTRPIKSKIGTKEGLKRDNAFFVYENVADKNNNISQKRVGLIKATKKISDNSRVTTGDFEPSIFYQYCGGKIEAGQTMKEKKLLNLALQVGGTVGAMSGLNVGLEMDFYSSRVTQSFLGIDGNIGGDGAGIGIYAGYGFRMSNFQLFPLLGGYFDTLFGSFTEEQKKENYAILGTIGAKANINIFFPFQVSLKAGYNHKFLEGNTYYYYKNNRKADGVNATVGVRYYF